MRRAVCPDCGVEMAVTAPAGGDGSADVFPRHPRGAADRCWGSRSVVGISDYYGSAT